MEKRNPYATPQAETKKKNSFSPSVFIHPPKVTQHYSCDLMSRREMVKLVHTALAQRLRGLKVLRTEEENASNLQVAIELTAIDLGNRFLRMLTIIFGAVRVESQMTVTVNGKIFESVPLVLTRRVGFQGGNSRKHLQSCLTQTGFMAGTRLGEITGKIPATNSKQATHYLALVSLVSWGAAILISVGLFFWALTVPTRMDGFAQDRKWFWAIPVFILLATIFHLFALAGAPEAVLESKQLRFLRTHAGVQTLKSQRIVIGLLTVVPMFLLWLWFGTL